MKVNSFVYEANFGNGVPLVQKEQFLAELKDNEIQINTKLVGICGSDTAVITGKEHYLGDGMWGHEGLGIVSAIGKKVTKFEVGDIVTSYWHPAFWEYYNVPENTAVKVPEINGKYILQPVACPLNALYNLSPSPWEMSKFLVIGSGFMAYTFTKYLDIFGWKYDVLANHNQEYFKNRVTEVEEESYTHVIMVSTNDYYDIAIKALKNSGTVIHYTTPRTPITTNFFAWNWKNIKSIFPSPRSAHYDRAFADSLMYIDRLGYEELLVEWDVKNIVQGFQADINKTGLVKNFIKMS